MLYFGIFDWNLKKILSFSKLVSSNFSLWKEVSFKSINIAYIYDQKVLYLGSFQLELEENTVIIEIKALEFVSWQSLVQNKNPQIWHQKCLTWVFLSWNFKKTIVIFEISVLEIVELQSSVPKEKFLNLGALYGYIWVIILKSNCHIFNQHTRIILIAIFSRKTKQKFLHLGPKMPYFCILEQEFEKFIFIFEISISEFVLILNLVQKQNR